MAYIHRVAVLLVAWFFMLPASAIERTTRYYFQGFDGKQYDGATVESACQSLVNALGAAWVVDEAGPGLLCRVKRTSDNFRSDRPGGTYLGCPDGSVEQGDECVSTEPPKTADEKCGDLAALYNSWNWAAGREGVVDSMQEHPLNKPFKVCMSNGDLLSGTGMDPSDYPPGCMHNFTATMRGTMGANAPGMRYWGNTWMVNDPSGRACVPGLDNQPGDPPDIPPAEPQGPCRGFEGSVNGVDVCIDPSSGRTVGVDWTRVTDADGNVKEQTTTVTCDGEECTVKTNTKTPGDPGEGTTTTTTTSRGAYCAKNAESAVCKGANDPTGSSRNQNGRGGPGDPAGTGNGGGNGEGNGFCKENPESPICKKGSFSGSCAASFACDGDAIQCAIAKEQHLRNCKMFNDPSPESQLYEANKGKEGNQTGELPGNETVNIAGRIDMSNALGAGSCVSDLTVTVWGQSVTLPFSAICPSLAMFGQLLVAVSLLLAARIVMRG